MAKSKAWLRKTIRRALMDFKFTDTKGEETKKYAETLTERIIKNFYRDFYLDERRGVK